MLVYQELNLVKMMRNFYLISVCNSNMEMQKQFIYTTLLFFLISDKFKLYKNKKQISKIVDHIIPNIILKDFPIEFIKWKPDLVIDLV